MHQGFRRLFILVGFATAAASPAFASSLLTSPYELQIESWLGQGDLAFTNIFTKTGGDDAGDFHAAADGMGPTITLLEVVYGGSTYIIGGYNPSSWTSGGFSNPSGDQYYRITPSDADRTAFIFNLTTATLQNQRLTSDPYGAAPFIDASDYGAFQSYNNPGYGPTFGGGFAFDIRVDGDLLHGQNTQNAYGAAIGNDMFTCFGHFGANIFGETTCVTGGTTSMLYGAIETYTFAPVAVPIPAAGWLLASALGLLLPWTRRRSVSLH